MQFFVYFTSSDGKTMNPPKPESMEEMGRFMGESMQSGIVVATGRLPAETTHVRLAGGEVSSDEGPFIDGPERVPGFTVIRTNSKQEAIDWAARLRGFMGDGIIRVAELPEGTYFE